MGYLIDFFDICEEESCEMLVEAVEEVSEDDEPAIVQDIEDEPAAIADSGTCGKNVTWTVSDDGVLTIRGTGDMYDYDSNGESPFTGSIETIIIEPGVTSIGAHAFQCYGVTSVTVPSTVTKIGDFAFEECSWLTDISLSEGLESIGDYAFVPAFA